MQAGQMINPVIYKNQKLENTVEYDFKDSILIVDNFVCHCEKLICCLLR